MNTVKRLRRDRKNAIFAGVLAGFSNYFEVDVVLLRVLFIFFVLITGIFPGIIAYLLAILVMPPEDQGPVIHQMPPEEPEKTDSV